MLRRATLMLTLAAIAVLVVAPTVEGKTVTCKSGQVCKGTNAADWIFGSAGNDNIRPMGGNDYVFGNGGADEVAHSYGDDRIFGGCGSDTVRGGFGLDRIFANMPDGLYPPGTTCVSITAPLTVDQTTAAEQAEKDIPDRAHDLVDCAWITSRGDPQPDKGFGSVEVGDIPDVSDDTVVDCSNRDDQYNNRARLTQPQQVLLISSAGGHKNGKNEGLSRWGN